MWKESKESAESDAKSDLLKLKCVRDLIKDNTLACKIEISGIEIWLCKNESVLPAIEYQINEIEKFLKGEPNDWE